MTFSRMTTPDRHLVEWQQQNDIQQNDIQQDEIQQNDIQQNDIQ